MPAVTRKKTSTVRRANRQKGHETVYFRNKKIIFANQTVCGICGHPVDFSLKFPDPLSPTIDHIIPIAKGGHPSDIDNLQLAHWGCNRQKADSVIRASKTMHKQELSNRILPQSFDWKNYRGHTTR
ncbi:MAG: HNH endonuclease [Lachnospiraceae bacterium]|nr:HNH endonuclease [Lachnospiraceae bacterium]